MKENRKMTSSKSDLERNKMPRLNESVFDPFLERRVEHPTTDLETLTHLLKASLGTGILAMPLAFQCAGLYVGIFATLFVSIVCTFCSHLLVKCAHVLYKRTRVTAMSYADVAEVAFAGGPEWAKRFSSVTRHAVLWLLFVTYFGTCCVYTVIIATNFQQVYSHHVPRTVLDLQSFIGMLLVPLVLLSYVPNLKQLAPVSTVANLLMASGLGITFMYLLGLLGGGDGAVIVALPRPQSLEVTLQSLDGFPTFFSITVFAMEAIGVVMPLENNMKFPKHLLGVCGVLSMGMGGVTVIYILLGFLGFLKYGEETKPSITLNLPIDEIPAQVAKVCIALAVFCTYGLQFFVCLEIAWTKIQDRFTTATTFHNYVLRTIMVTGSVIIAIAVPTIGPFIGLIGAFCFSLLGIIAPVVIEFATFSETVTLWMIIRNVVLIIVGIMALIFGTASSISDIVAMYMPAEVHHALNGTVTVE